MQLMFMLRIAYCLNPVLRPIHTSTLHGARSTEHGARSISIHTSTYRSCVRMIKYIVFDGKVKICSTLDFHPCSVLCVSMKWPLSVLSGFRVLRVLRVLKVLKVLRVLMVLMVFREF